MTKYFYDSKIVGKEVLGRMKCYFAHSEKFPMYEERKKELKGYLENAGVSDSLGFALVWNVDALIGRARKDGQGFDLSVYDFGTGAEKKYIERVCFLDGILEGKESGYLMRSRSEKAYMRKWMLKKRFRKKYNNFSKRED